MCRPFVDFSPNSDSSIILKLYSDESKSLVRSGMGAVFLNTNSWIVKQWDSSFLKSVDPSIEFLELYALVAAITTWSDYPIMRNRRVTVYCDNEAIVHMINNCASSCVQCLKLIRLLTIDNIRANRRVFCLHIGTKLNLLADSLSRFNFSKFWQFAPREMKQSPDIIQLVEPETLWQSNSGYIL